jgi:hypothetical protein
MISVMMHSVACGWLYIGAKFEQSWIRNPVKGVEAFY